MAASMPDLMIHVDESLSPADMQQLEERLRAGAGVVSAHRSADATHLLLVSYDSNRTSAHDLLDVVTRTGVHAELVGL